MSGYKSNNYEHESKLCHQEQMLGLQKHVQTQSRLFNSVNNTHSYHGLERQTGDHDYMAMSTILPPSQALSKSNNTGPNGGSSSMGLTAIDISPFQPDMKFGGIMGVQEGANVDVNWNNNDTYDGGFAVIPDPTPTVPSHKDPGFHGNYADWSWERPMDMIPDLNPYGASLWSSYSTNPLNDNEKANNMDFANPMTYGGSLNSSYSTNSWTNNEEANNTDFENPMLALNNAPSFNPDVYNNVPVPGFSNFADEEAILPRDDPPMRFPIDTFDEESGVSGGFNRVPAGITTTQTGQTVFEETILNETGPAVGGASKNYAQEVPGEMNGSKRKRQIEVLGAPTQAYKETPEPEECHTRTHKRARTTDTYGELTNGQIYQDIPQRSHNRVKSIPQRGSPYEGRSIDSRAKIAQQTGIRSRLEKTGTHLRRQSNIDQLHHRRETAYKSIHSGAEVMAPKSRSNGKLPGISPHTQSRTQQQRMGQRAPTATSGVEAREYGDDLNDHGVIGTQSNPLDIGENEPSSEAKRIAPWDTMNSDRIECGETYKTHAGHSSQMTPGLQKSSHQSRALIGNKEFVQVGTRPLDNTKNQVDKFALPVSENKGLGLTTDPLPSSEGRSSTNKHYINGDTEHIRGSNPTLEKAADGNKRSRHSLDEDDDVVILGSKRRSDTWKTQTTNPSRPHTPAEVAPPTIDLNIKASRRLSPHQTSSTPPVIPALPASSVPIGEPVDYREITPTNQKERESLDQALQSTRDGYFEWIGEPAPMTQSGGSYTSQHGQLQNSFEFAWGMKTNDQAPKLIKLPAWNSSIDDFPQPQKNRAYYAPYYYGHRALMSEDGKISDLPGELLEEAARKGPEGRDLMVEGALLALALMAPEQYGRVRA